MAEMLQITPREPFSLQAAPEFGFGPNSDRTLRYDGVLRLGRCWGMPPTSTDSPRR